MPNGMTKDNYKKSSHASNNKIILRFANVKYLKSKKSEIEYMIVKHNVNILALPETWTNSSDPDIQLLPKDF